MATSTYMTGRKKYGRPQAMLWSNNPGTLVNGLYVPTGTEVNSDPGSFTSSDYLDQFLILSDHNRSEISMSPERIEKRERMINGRMRSYHVADKLKIDVSWDMLPSRAYRVSPEFNQTTGKSSLDGLAGKPNAADSQYTVDGGAGAAEMLDWYEKHKGSFWVFLAYDKYTNFPTGSEYGHLAQYNEIIEVYFSKFDYSISKRGNGYGDLWKVSVSLEEA